MIFFQYLCRIILLHVCGMLVITIFSSHRLAFRSLVRKYSCDICYTPMIVACDFMRSAKARDSEFTTNQSE